jgi:hypothetical protein
MTDTDHEPTLLPSVEQALHAVGKEADPEGRRINRITIRLLDSGQVTYRLHSREHEHYIGGVLSIAGGPKKQR